MNSLLLVLTLLLCNCEKTTDNILNHNRFIGQWQLISVSGGFSPHENFQSDEIIWKFQSNDTLEITTNVVVTNSSRLPIKKDTVLTYSYDTNYLVIDNHKYEYKIDKNSLKLFDNLHSDGIMLEFVKK